MRILNKCYLVFQLIKFRKTGKRLVINQKNHYQVGLKTLKVKLNSLKNGTSFRKYFFISCLLFFILKYIFNYIIYNKGFLTCIKQ
jgi:hypothetical protein